MQQERLNLYTVDMKLIRNYHNQGDSHVFSVSPQSGKKHRPFVGIIVICDGKQYCVPLSSPKKKHEAMNNGIDFHKILDSNGKLIAVLNFNNMIPVRDDVLRKIEIRLNKDDSEASLYYKSLAIDELKYCRRNQDTIVEKANNLYRMMQGSNANSKLKRRCLRWDRLEKILERYKNETVI